MVITKEKCDWLKQFSSYYPSTNGTQTIHHIENILFNIELYGRWAHCWSKVYPCIIIMYIHFLEHDIITTLLTIKEAQERQLY